jgi:predicted MFS family arabinose efflux permease
VASLITGTASIDQNQSVQREPVLSDGVPASGGSSLPIRSALLISLACGLAVANVYYAQPLLDVIGAEFQISQRAVGLVVTITQIGYGVGLLLVVPLGDLVNRRRLIVGQSLLSVGALFAVALAPTATVFLFAMALVGVLAVVAQILVAFAASLAHPKERGRIVGIVTSGIILGILLARTVSGTLADALGWRSVYAVSAIATTVVAALMFKTLPGEPQVPKPVTYRRLIGFVFTLFASETVLRVRGVLALLSFAAVTALWTPMVLPLSAAPYSLSHTSIGLFGLAGAIGAMGAASAGRLADRGHAQRTTCLALALMLASWLPIVFLRYSLWGLMVGVITIDFGLQSVHVSNQSLIYRVRPEAQSRLTAGYMVCYSIGCGLGSILSTLAYARAGWNGVCALGAVLSASALLFWALTRHLTPEATTWSSTSNSERKI